MRPSSYHSPRVVEFGKDVGDVLTAQDGSHVSEIDGCCPFFLLLGHVVQSKLLIMGQRKHLSIGQESRVVDGPMIESLDDDFVLVRNGGVANVYESVGRA